MAFPVLNVAAAWNAIFFKLQKASATQPPRQKTEASTSQPEVPDVQQTLLFCKEAEGARYCEPDPWAALAYRDLSLPASCPDTLCEASRFLRHCSMREGLRSP